MTTERTALIDALRRFPDRLESLIAQVYSNELTVQYIPGAWTVAQNIHHLADAHLNGYTRMRLVITEDQPTFKPYDQDQWALLADAASSNIQPSMQILRSLHQRWADMLEHVPDAAWKRTGIHPDDGEETLEELLRIYVNHGVAHIEQISQVLAARPLVYCHGVTYEVTVDIAAELVNRFQKYMNQKHIPEIFATGLFRHILFEQSSPTRFRTAYIAESRELIDTYLHEHATYYRADFLEHFPNGVSVMREIWSSQNTWGTV